MNIPERELLQKSKNDIRARNQLVLNYLAYIHTIARKYNRKYNNDIEMQNDLINEGVIGLIKAIEKFDMNYEVQLGTYARMWIEAAVKEYCLRNKSIVKGTRERNDRHAEKRIYCPDICIEKADLHFAPEIYGKVEPEIEQSLFEKDYNKAIGLLHILDERSRDIITNRYLKEKAATLKELARKYHVSEERIRQIESVGLLKLRDGLGN